MHSRLRQLTMLAIVSVVIGACAEQGITKHERRALDPAAVAAFKRLGLEHSSSSSITEGIAPVQLSANVFFTPPSGYTDAVVNGGFESGFAGWTRSADGLGYNGSTADAWLVGATDVNAYDFMPHDEPLAHAGAAGASAIENGPTLHKLWQDVTIADDGSAQPVTLHFWLRWKNLFESWVRLDPSCANFFDCQDVVVQLRDPGTNALLTEVWSAFATSAPMFSGGGDFVTANYQLFSFDISAYKGQTVRLQFENRVCCNVQYLDIDDVQVFVPIADSTPPVTGLAIAKTSLWPPNHQMVQVAQGTATDIVDPSPTVSITVTSNEPANGLGDGDTAPDWRVTQNGSSYSIELRAERAGGGSGRTYTIAITVTDAAGNETFESFSVTVPKSKGK